MTRMVSLRREVVINVLEETPIVLYHGKNLLKYTITDRLRLPRTARPRFPLLPPPPSLFLHSSFLLLPPYPAEMSLKYKHFVRTRQAFHAQPPHPIDYL